MKKLLLAATALTLAACGGSDEARVPDPEHPPVSLLTYVKEELDAGREPVFHNELDAIAADFVKLALRMGQVDPGYVDAYHGPAQWSDAAAAEDVDPEVLADDITALTTRLAAFEVLQGDEEIRVEQMGKLLRAMGVRLQVIRGESVSFEKEVSDIYDVTYPDYDMAEFEAALVELDVLLPGEGSLAERMDAFRNRYEIPADKLQAVFDRAIEECRIRTKKYFRLPDDEKFRMEFVNDEPWSGYNYYQGDYESLIQINTDFPIVIDRAVDLGCHEGYPGHHVWNLFIESELVGERGWIEYTVNPLYSPFAPIAEGSGNYGIIMAFPGDEKATFERDVLYPLAGLDPDTADELEAVKKVGRKLSHATNEISRMYLNGEISREDAIPMMQKYYLASAEKSAQRLRFVEAYRGYVINYNIGQDLVAAYVNAAGDEPEARWDAFKKLLITPMTASDIEKALGE